MPTKFKLNTGAEIPAIGFGTWQDAGSQENAVAEAIRAGYRHIDTAQACVYLTLCCTRSLTGVDTEPKNPSEKPFDPAASLAMSFL